MKYGDTVRRVLSATSTLILVASVCAWFWSYRRLDIVSRVRGDGVTFAAMSYQGALHFLRGGDSARPRGLTWDQLQIPRDAGWDDLYQGSNIEWQRWGAAHVYQRAGLPVYSALFRPPPTATITRTSTGGILVFSRPTASPTPLRHPLAPWLMVMPFHSYVMPLWPIALLSALMPARAALRHTRGLIRRRRGCCASCGYDLRASPQRCPECGARILRPVGARLESPPADAS